MKKCPNCKVKTITLLEFSKKAIASNYCTTCFECKKGWRLKKRNFLIDILGDAFFLLVFILLAYFTKLFLSSIGLGILSYYIFLITLKYMVALAPCDEVIKEKENWLIFISIRVQFPLALMGLEYAFQSFGGLYSIVGFIVGFFILPLCIYVWRLFVLTTGLTKSLN